MKTIVLRVTEAEHDIIMAARAKHTAPGVASLPEQAFHANILYCPHCDGKDGRAVRLETRIINESVALRGCPQCNRGVRFYRTDTAAGRARRQAARRESTKGQETA